jgi:hypothetical protein
MGSGVKTSRSSLPRLFANFRTGPATTKREHVNPIGVIAPLLDKTL